MVAKREEPKRWFYFKWNFDLKVTVIEAVSFEEVVRLVDQTRPAHFALAEVRTEVTKTNHFCMLPGAMRSIEILAYAAGT